MNRELNMNRFAAVAAAFVASFALSALPSLKTPIEVLLRRRQAVRQSHSQFRRTKPTNCRTE